MANKQDNITSLLQDWLRVIKQQLFSKFQKLFDEELNKIHKSNPELTNLNSELEKASLEKESLENERDRIYKLYEEIKSKIRDKDKELDSIKSKINSIYPRVQSNKLLDLVTITYKNTSHQEALDKIIWTEEVNNIQALEAIEMKFNQLMALAITPKEKRDVVLQFYSIDWDSLWVVLPMDKNIWDVKVINWVINVWNKLLK